MNVLQKFEKQNERGKTPDFRSGDTVRVHVKILEGEKERIQVFEGVVIRRRAGGNRSSFTVRKISYGVGVERIFPTHTPMIDRVDVVQRGRVRRSRLYYLRELRGKAARIRSKRIVPTTGTAVREEDIVPEPAESPAE